MPARAPAERRRSSDNLFISINSLPVELLCKIFHQFVILGDIDADRKNNLVELAPNCDYRRHRMNLTHVCLTWRRIAHGFAKLWVDLFVNAHFDREIQLHSVLIEEWTQRSKNLPLNIRLSYEGGAIRQQQTPRPSAFRPLVSSFGRVKSLFLILTSHTESYSFLLYASSALPALETLDLSLSAQLLYLPALAQNAIDFRASTKLKSVKLRLDFGSLLGYFHFPQTELSSFTLEFSGFEDPDVNVSKLLDILSGFTNLIECNIWCPRKVYQTTIPSPDRIVTLPALQSLKLWVQGHMFAEYRNHAVWHLLGALRTPSLQMLDLEHSAFERYPYDHFNASIIKNFLVRSRAPLTEVRFDNVLLSREDYNDILPELSAVARLTDINAEYRAEFLVEALEYRQGQPPLLPSLRYLEIGVVDSHPYPSIASMIQSRWLPGEVFEGEEKPMGRRLEHLRIQDCIEHRRNSLQHFDIFDEDAIGRIDTCRVKGFCVEGYYPFRQE